MPRHLELKKEGRNKRRNATGVVRTQDPSISNGKPGSSNELSPMSEYIAHEEVPGELKHLSIGRKKRMIP